MLCSQAYFGHKADNPYIGVPGWGIILARINLLGFELLCREP
jgi:hypothetical protein